MQEQRTRRPAPYQRAMSRGQAVLYVIVGVVMFVIAQFPPETEGEPPAVWDWVRHGVCFLGGALLAVGLVRGFNRWRRISGGNAISAIILGIVCVLFAQFAMENQLFDEGESLAGVPVWIVQHTVIFLGGIAAYVGMNRFYEANS
jgi:peptidoglycan/LPS O-acetylase OafA/YrhL